MIETRGLVENPAFVSKDLEIYAKPFEARVYVNDKGDTLRYRLLLPLHYDSSKEYPIVVCLHGSSGCGSDNVRQVAASLPAWILSTQGNREKYPSFLFVPQCPINKCWGGVPGVPSVESSVIETIRLLEKEFPIDTNRCYVAGNSLGGIGTWYMICTHPEMFAAAVPISGKGDSSLAKKIIDIPVWAFHGEEDKNVSVHGSEDMIAAIKKAGGNPMYTEFPDKAHDIWNEVIDTPGLWHWLFEQKRNR